MLLIVIIRFLPGGILPCDNVLDTPLIEPDPCLDFIDDANDIASDHPWLESLIEVRCNSNVLDETIALGLVSNEPAAAGFRRETSVASIVGNAPGLLSQHAQIKPQYEVLVDDLLPLFVQVHFVQKQMIKEAICKKNEMQIRRHEAERGAQEIVSASSIFGDDGADLVQQFLSPLSDESLVPSREESGIFRTHSAI